MCTLVSFLVHVCCLNVQSYNLFCHGNGLFTKCNVLDLCLTDFSRKASSIAIAFFARFPWMSHNCAEYRPLYTTPDAYACIIKLSTKIQICDRAVQIVSWLI